VATDEAVNADRMRTALEDPARTARMKSIKDRLNKHLSPFSLRLSPSDYNPGGVKKQFEGVFNDIRKEALATAKALNIPPEYAYTVIKSQIVD
jgi:hypothetical protein